MVTIKINGRSEALSEEISLQELLDRFQIPQTATAVALNSEIVPRSSLAEVLVRQGDQVEIVRAIGGG